MLSTGQIDRNACLVTTSQLHRASSSPAGASTSAPIRRMDYGSDNATVAASNGGPEESPPCIKTPRIGREPCTRRQPNINGNTSGDG
ncbi:hypothetical protein J6590_045925 [Homalodisca vitripennis]|nr:hypothetical protein J6590_045925 [Homalodisca vitripennis]